MNYALSLKFLIFDFKLTRMPLNVIYIITIHLLVLFVLFGLKVLKNLKQNKSLGYGFYFTNHEIESEEQKIEISTKKAHNTLTELMVFTSFSQSICLSVANLNIGLNSCVNPLILFSQIFELHLI